MAFASSRIGTQEAIIKPCDLCEDDENVNWFCRDCIQNLCESCKKIHLKIAACKNHRLVSILEGVVIQKINVSNLCQEHDEPFTFFCRICEENICSICLSLVHKKHEFVDLRNLQSELQIKLENVIKDKEDERLEISNNKDEFEKYANKSKETLEKGCATIDYAMKALHKAVDEEGQNLKDFLIETTEKQITEIDELTQKLEGKKNEYDETIQTVKQELALQTESNFNQFVKTSIAKLHSIQPLRYALEMSTTFVAGRTNNDLIAEMIGKPCGEVNIRELDETERKSEINIFSKLHFVNIMKLGIPKVAFSMCTCPDGCIWICGWDSMYKMSSDCSTILHQIPFRGDVGSCHNIACLQSGDAVVSYCGFAVIDKYTIDGKREVFLNFSHMAESTHHIAVTNNNEIVASIRVNGGWWSTKSFLLTYHSLRKGLVYAQRIRIDNDITSFFLDQNGNYITSVEESGCLTKLDVFGTVLKKKQFSSLMGNSKQKKTKNTFRRMICDEFGNIIGVTGDKQIYVISDDWEVERLFTVECDKCINDISVDRDNRLFILVDTEKVIVAKYFYGK